MKLTEGATQPNHIVWSAAWLTLVALVIAVGCASDTTPGSSAIDSSAIDSESTEQPIDIEPTKTETDYSSTANETTSTTTSDIAPDPTTTDPTTTDPTTTAPDPTTASSTTIDALETTTTTIPVTSNHPADTDPTTPAPTDPTTTTTNPSTTTTPLTSRPPTTTTPTPTNPPVQTTNPPTTTTVPTNPPTTTTVPTNPPTTTTVPTNPPTTTTVPTNPPTTTTVPHLVFDKVGSTKVTDGVANWTVEIVERIPHDPDAFTQGLEVADGVMYESTGLYGESSLRTVDSASGTVTKQTNLSDDLFGEGLTVVNDRIIQLTWKSGTALVYDRNSFKQQAEYQYEGEGWGLCRMGDTLWMSDGSNTLSRRHPVSFDLIDTILVTSSDSDINWDNLNELECFDGRIIANRWQTDQLLVIDVSEDGRAQVEAVIDASQLVLDARKASPDKPINVLNGVADTRDGSGTLWLTGKHWPWLYRVRLVPA